MFERRDISDHPSSFGDAWTRSVARAPGRVALVDARDGSHFRVSELDALLRRAAAGLLAQGVQQGDRVLLRAAPEVETLLAIYAAMSLGAVPVVLHPRSPGARTEEIARATGARPVGEPATLFDHPPLETLPRAQPEDDAVLLFSSGSTGPAKGIRLSHGALVAGTLRVIGLFPLQPDERHGVPALFHTLPGLRGALLLPTLEGTSAVLLEPEAPAAALLASCGEHAVALLHAGPALVTAVSASPDRLRRLVPPGLRAAKIGGAPLTLEARRSFASALGVALVYSYGLTETGGTCSAAITLPDGSGPPGVGRPLVPVAIVDEDGAPVPPGVVGLIELAPDPPMSGYLDGSGPAIREGRAWLQTGDLGWLDAEGHLFVQGRQARQFTTPTGEKVLLADLDAQLQEALGVEAVAASVASPRRLPRLGALVAATALSEAWISQARATLRARLPEHAVPTLWVSAPALPRLPGGKVDFEAVGQLLSAQAEGQPSSW